MDMRYNLVSEFEINGKNMVTVMIDENAHVMDKKDLQRMYGCWHPEYWERWNRKRNKKCKKSA